MNLQTCKILTLLFKITLLYPVVANPCFGNMQPYLQGTVISTADRKGIDSVRVASKHFRSVSFTESRGMFSFERPSDSTCKPDTTILDSLYRYTVSLSPHTEKQVFTRKTPRNYLVRLHDLHGRLIAEEKITGPEKVFPRKNLPGGVVIVSVEHRRPSRHLLLGNDIRGSISQVKELEHRITPPSCRINDTLYFYKRGYRPGVVHITSAKHPVTIQLQPQRRVSSDIHSHTVLTDGLTTLDTLLSYSFDRFGLNVFANCEHGGIFPADTSSLPIIDQPEHKSAPTPDQSRSYSVARWYSLSHFAWPKLCGQRTRYPEKQLLLGLEWNVPGHEHASVGFIRDNDQPKAVAEFEYRFDANDPDTSRGNEVKANTGYHSNALTALSWLQEQYAGAGYCFINHPSRMNSSTNPIKMFRDFHNTAPDVFLGMEAMPGHQKHYTRGLYEQVQTLGGADPIVATIGGLWDALLGEGRRMWIIVNSDFHHTGQDFWPGEYAKTWTAVTDTGLQAFLDGMRSGNMFAVHGDLINALTFSVSDDLQTAEMGNDMHTDRSHLTVEIRFRSPPVNNHGDNVSVDHIDLIRGEISGRVPPTDPEYNTPLNPTTTRIAQFSRNDWTTVDGWNIITFETDIEKPVYFRLRGTNLPLSAPGETDAEGNPLPDLKNFQNGTIAWRDLWFYSNPIFVYLD